jgi:hypothetical protein
LGSAGGRKISARFFSEKSDLHGSGKAGECKKGLDLCRITYYSGGMSNAANGPQEKRRRGRPSGVIDKETLEKIRQQFKEGASNRRVAKEFGIHRDKVQELRLQLTGGDVSAKGSPDARMEVAGIDSSDVDKLRHRPAVDIGFLHLVENHIVLGIRFKKLGGTGKSNLPPWPPALPWPDDYTTDDIAPASPLVGDRARVIRLAKALREWRHKIGAVMESVSLVEFLGISSDIDTLFVDSSAVKDELYRVSDIKVRIDVIPDLDRRLPFWMLHRDFAQMGVGYFPTLGMLCQELEAALAPMGEKRSFTISRDVQEMEEAMKLRLAVEKAVENVGVLLHTEGRRSSDLARNRDPRLWSAMVRGRALDTKNKAFQIAPMLLQSGVFEWGYSEVPTDPYDPYSLDFRDALQIVQTVASKRRPLVALGRATAAEAEVIKKNQGHPLLPCAKLLTTAGHWHDTATNLHKIGRLLEDRSIHAELWGALVLFYTSADMVEWDFEENTLRNTHFGKRLREFQDQIVSFLLQERKGLLYFVAQKWFYLSTGDVEDVVEEVIAEINSFASRVVRLGFDQITCHFLSLVGREEFLTLTRQETSSAVVKVRELLNADLRRFWPVARINRGRLKQMLIKMALSRAQEKHEKITNRGMRDMSDPESFIVNTAEESSLGGGGVLDRDIALPDAMKRLRQLIVQRLHEVKRFESKDARREWWSDALCLLRVIAPTVDKASMAKELDIPEAIAGRFLALVPHGGSDGQDPVPPPGKIQKISDRIERWFASPS